MPAARPRGLCTASASALHLPWLGPQPLTRAWLPTPLRQPIPAPTPRPENLWSLWNCPSGEGRQATGRSGPWPCYLHPSLGQSGSSLPAVGAARLQGGGLGTQVKAAPESHRRPCPPRPTHAHMPAGTHRPHRRLSPALPEPRGGCPSGPGVQTRSWARPAAPGRARADAGLQGPWKPRMAVTQTLPLIALGPTAACDRVT